MQDCRISINTGLPGFHLLQEITSVETGVITGSCRLSDVPLFLGIESLAQLGACHVRFLTDFGKRAFLLKISRCLMPEKKILEGLFRLRGTLIGRGNEAFSYRLEAERDKELEIAGNFLYAAADYESDYQRERMREYYLRQFSCLTNATGKSS